ncbi:MAG TPA: ATP-binding protein [Dyella sp.]|jgi:signal transduction histidine kinase|nr:ATP-binding protein [Dyella sp.]HET6432144.1 ATP-binding protein [Dyella sp.]
MATLMLLAAGALTTAYQYHANRIERGHRLTVQANILAASVTAAIAFNDRATAQEYVNALELDSRLEAAAVYDQAHRRVAGFHRPGTLPIDPALIGRETLRPEAGLVEVTARQGSTLVGFVYLRSTRESLLAQATRYSGVLLLTLMAALMLTALAVAQRALARANAALGERATELADAYTRLSAEMEQRARTEEALRQSQKMEAIGQLSGGVAHDFNNLLMIIRGSLTRLEQRLQQSPATIERPFHETLAAGHDEPPAPGGEAPVVVARGSRDLQLSRYLDMAHEAIDRAAGLVQRLLSFARKQPLSPKRLNLDDLIRGIQPLLGHSLGSNVSIDFQLQSRWSVFCDANQMENAILNLIINARDAMPSGGRITLRTEDITVDTGRRVNEVPAGDHVHLQVTDTGTGMSDDVRRKAFDPFFTTKPVGQGSGLGLSTILGYVEQSHGVIWIESQAGHGTTLHIVLPRDTVDLISEEA